MAAGRIEVEHVRPGPPPRSRRGLFIGAAVLIAIGAAGGWWWSVRTPVRQSVLVAVYGADAETAERLSAYTTDALRGAGIDVIVPPDGLVIHAGEAGEAEARAIELADRGAAPQWVLWTWESATTDPLPASARIGLVVGEPGRTRRTEPIELAHDASSIALARIAIARRAMAALMPTLLRDLFSSPIYDDVRRGESRSIEADLLADAIRTIDDRAWPASRTPCTGVSPAEENVSCASETCAEESAIGIDVDGDAIVRVAPRLRLGGYRSRVELIATEERIERIHDGERSVIARAGRFRTYPSLSADGRWMALVREISSPNERVTMRLEIWSLTNGGAPRMVHETSDTTIESPRLSRDGGAVLWYERGGGDVLRLSAQRLEDGAFASFDDAWSAAWVTLEGETRLAVLRAVLAERRELGDRHPRAHTPALELVLASPSLTQSAIVGSPEPLHELFEAQEGLGAMAGSGGRCSIGILTSQSGTIAFHRIGRCVTHATSIGGMHVIAQHDRSHAIVDAEYAAGSVTPMTGADLESRYPRVSPDGIRVLFERIDRDPQFGTSARACVLTRQPIGLPSTP